MSRIVVQALLLISLVSGDVVAQTASPRKDIRTIAKAANGAIVSIVMSDKDGKPIGQGSGFFVSEDGFIITNYHVIAQGTSAVVKLPNDALYPVDCVVAFNKARDTALIKAHGQNFRTLAIGNSDRIQVGEEVVAIGNPLSLESTVSNGIVSGLRTVDELGGKFLQITAPISPGSSGGPLFNMSGEVVGITTMYLKGGENLNFAIPINEVKKLLADVEGSRKALADPEFFKRWGSNFPNEPAPKETHSEATHHKSTLEEQKMCSEQADKVLQKRQLEEKDNPLRPTFDDVSHYDASTGICYVEISRNLYGRVDEHGSTSQQQSFIIEDAFEGKEVGILSQTLLIEMQGISAFPQLCIIRPPGQPEIRCSSETEFDDLALRYFGIQK